MPTLERNPWVPCVFGNIYVRSYIRYADTLTWRSFTVFHDESLDKEQVAVGIKIKWHKNLSRQRRCTECLPKMPPLPSLTLATSATWTQGCRLLSSATSLIEIMPKKTVDRIWCWCQWIREKQSAIRKILQNFPGHDLGNRCYLVQRILNRDHAAFVLSLQVIMLCVKVPCIDQEGRCEWLSLSGNHSELPASSPLLTEAL